MTAIQEPVNTRVEGQCNIDAAFLTAGRAVFTVEPSAEFVEATGCKPHYTFKFTSKDGERGRITFVALLSGPDNEADYTYLGVFTGHEVRLTGKSAFPASSVPVRIVQRVAAALVRGEGERIAAGGWRVHHEGRCNRVLTVPESVSFGIGPECRKKM